MQTLERRNNKSGKPSLLPHDYLKLVRGVFGTHYQGELKELTSARSTPSFEVYGEVFADEIVLCVSLTQSNQIQAYSGFASCDFDPQASAPSLHDLLSECVDALESLFSVLLSKKNLADWEAIQSQPLSQIEGLPLRWTEAPARKHTIYFKVDRTNLKLDQLADQWLDQNDPSRKKLH